MLDSRESISQASREELIDWLENHRSTACYDNESTGLLREAAMEDLPAFLEETGTDCVTCKFCEGEDNAGLSHLHHNEWVCTECWDERLSITV